MNVVLLLVTWLGVGGGSSYQVPFPTYAMCEAAKNALHEDAKRIGEKVVLSAVCVDQKG